MSSIDEEMLEVSRQQQELIKQTEEAAKGIDEMLAIHKQHQELLKRMDRIAVDIKELVAAQSDLRREIAEFERKHRPKGA